MRTTLVTSRFLDGLSLKGLDDQQLIKQRSLYGDNGIEDRSKSVLREMAEETARDPMLWFLLSLAILFLSIGNRSEAFLLFLALIPLIGMDTFLSWRTARSTRKLRTHLQRLATVLRQGQRMQVPARSLVPGDLVFLAADDPIPADGIFMEAEGIQVDESPLSGESLPLKKQALRQLPSGLEVSIPKIHWGYAGTKVLAGHATFKVAYVGAETHYGQIIQAVETAGREQTPLQNDMGHLVKILLVVAFGFCLVLMIARLMEGKGWLDALIGAATLAVAALPEEFPVVFTFYLGAGVYRIAHRRALVRRAVAVENIGRVSCICSDKTGTLTEGILRLVHLRASADHSEEELLEAAALASREESRDPIDTSILQRYARARPDFGSQSIFPFTELRRRETSVYRMGESVRSFCKGSPETVMALCNLSSRVLGENMRLTERLAREGHKVIGVAQRELKASEWDGREPDSAYNFLGLLGFEDPIRSEVPDAVGHCRAAGIHVLMVTGDHPDTAKTIAQEIGLGEGSPRVLNAADPSFNVSSIPSLLAYDVVARALPLQKMEIVAALKAQGECVAVTGDGINDVPALRIADIGIAMGGRGTSAARDVASIVLSDDNFATLVDAIAEGRQLLKNLRKSFQYLLIVHIPLVAAAAIIPLAAYPLLFLPIHIVWLELMIHPTALFAFQEPGAAHLKKMPQSRKEQLLSKQEWILVFSGGSLLFAVLTSLYAWGIFLGSDTHARTLALATLLFGASFAAAFLSGLRTSVSRLIVGSTWLINGFLLAGPYAKSLQLAQLKGLGDWLLVILGAGLASILPFALVNWWQADFPTKAAPRES